MDNPLFITWYESFFERREPHLLVEPISVVGTFNKDLGPAFFRASFRCSVEPSENFEFSEQDAADRSAEHRDYLRSGLFGLFDMLVLETYFPVANVRLTISDVLIHPVGSNRFSFRQCGRDAGAKIVRHWRGQLSSPLSAPTRQ